MDLEDLVTGHLASEQDSEEEVFEAQPPLDIIGQHLRISTDQLRELCRAFPQKITDTPSDAPYLATQILAYLERSFGLLAGTSRAKRELVVVASAATYAREPDDELLESLTRWVLSIEEAIEQREFERLQQMAIGSGVAQIDFLGEFFGEELLDELVEMLGVKRATARRWIDGANMNWENSQRIKMLAKIFYALRHKQEMDNEEALVWYRETAEGFSVSPREMFKSFVYSPRGDFQAVLRGIGITGN